MSLFGLRMEFDYFALYSDRNATSLFVIADETSSFLLSLAYRIMKRYYRLRLHALLLLVSCGTVSSLVTNFFMRSWRFSLLKPTVGGDLQCECLPYNVCDLVFPTRIYQMAVGPSKQFSCRCCLFCKFVKLQNTQVSCCCFWLRSRLSQMKELSPF